MNLLEKALAALEYHTRQTRPIQDTEDVMTELRAAIAGGPVAWRHDHGQEGDGWEYYEGANCPACVALYDLSCD